MPKHNKKKVNPRRQPATMADLKRAKEKAEEKSLETAWSIFFTVLRDKEGFRLDDLRRVWVEVEDLSDSIVKGYCTVSDLRGVLRLEEGVILSD